MCLIVYTLRLNLAFWSLVNSISIISVSLKHYYHVFFDALLIVILLLLAPLSFLLASHPKLLNGRAPQGFVHINFFSFSIPLSVTISLRPSMPSVCQ